MQVEIRVDKTCASPRVIILTDSVTEEIRQLARRLSGEGPAVLTGFREDTVHILDPERVLRVYAAAGKVFAVTDEGEYTLRSRLYELEERLDPGRFVRISHSELINLRKVESFDLSFSGTICVKLCDGTASYVSRRYVPKIRDVLGI